MKRTPLLVGLGIAVAWAGLSVIAGPLDPPAGPVASTGKTLTEVEPRIAVNAANTPGDAISVFRITQPGSYYLTGNITGVSGKNGIVIAASGVTLDLMGFELVGAAGSSDGVFVNAPSVQNAYVMNGTSRNWGGRGVNIGQGSHHRAVDLRLSGNGQEGLTAGSNTFVQGCTAWQNTGVGIRVFDHGLVRECAARANAGGGIYGSNGCLIEGCSVVANSGSGVQLVFGGAVSRCVVASSSMSGISVLDGACSITDCTLVSNGMDGIRVVHSCTIRGNTCAFSGNAGDGAGIRATGGRNRIEGNICSSADRGIDVDVAGNIIVGNTCSGNTTNWEVVAGNVCLVVQGAVGAAIMGDTGGVSPGSTDPNANFTY